VIKIDELKIYTLGEFKVKYKDKVITKQGGVNTKPWILFKYLITKLGRNVNPEKLINDLWPKNNNVKEPRHSLTNLFYRLRKYIEVAKNETEESYLINTHDKCSFNTHSNYWLDVYEFERLCKQAQLLTTDAPLKAIDVYENAMDLYKGDYLPEIPYQDWVIYSRRNYHWFYIENVIDYIKLLKEKDKLEKIITICQKSIKIEPLETEIHNEYIETLIKLGKTNQAKSHYQYVKELFIAKLNIDDALPSFDELYTKNSIDNNLDSIKKELKTGDKIKGTYLCDSDLFRLLFKIEKTRVATKNSKLILESFKFENTDYFKQNKEKVEKILINNLQRGDILTCWSERQYLALLTNKDKSVVKKASEKIKRLLYSEMNINEKNITIVFEEI
jgi:two-component SAPR family response regulator